jgi:hypothetical protein
MIGCKEKEVKIEDDGSTIWLLTYSVIAEPGSGTVAVAVAVAVGVAGDGGDRDGCTATDVVT